MRNAGEVAINGTSVSPPSPSSAASLDPDLPLVRALQGGDEAALTGLMERHREVIFRYVWRSVGNEEDARDLTQETFVRAYFAIRTFEPSAPFTAWLYRIATNLCRDRVRSRAFKQSRLTASLADSPIERPGSERAPGELLVAREQMEEMRAAIADLPVELREPFTLAVLDELPQAEAGAQLGLTAKAVEVKVYRARKLLLKRFGVGRQ